MKEYDIERLHKACLDWAETAIFPFADGWQRDYGIAQTTHTIAIHDLYNTEIARIPRNPLAFSITKICLFAHVIGIDFESFVIKPSTTPQP